MASTLSPEVIATTLKAMVATILDRRPSTQDVAATMPIAIVDGEQVHGAPAARKILVDALAAHEDQWVEWLSDPEHVKPATSMVVALDEDLVAQLRSLGATALLGALEDIASGSATAKVIASRNRAELDLREAQPVIDLTSSNVAV